MIADEVQRGRRIRAGLADLLVTVAAFVGGVVALAIVGAQIQQSIGSYLAGDVGYQPPLPGAPADWSLLTFDVVAGCGAFACVLGIRRYAGIPERIARPAWRLVRGGTLALAIMSVVGAVAAVTAELTAVEPGVVTELEGPGAIAYAAGITAAGFEEEPVFVLLPFLALTLLARWVNHDVPRPAQVPQWPVGFPPARWVLALAAVSGLARGAFHLYQGPVWAVAAVLWGAAMVLVYARWRSITALIVAHGLYNLLLVYLLPLAGLPGVLVTAVQLVVPTLLWLIVVVFLRGWPRV